MFRFAPAVDARNRARRFALALAALTAIAVPLRVYAQASDSFDLAWNAPPGCPSAANVLQRIDLIAGSSTIADTKVQAEGSITRNRSGRLHLKLRVRVGRLVGERQLDASSCDDLAGAAAVNLVLLLRSAEAAAAPAPPAPDTRVIRSRTAAPRSPAPPPSAAGRAAGDSDRSFRLRLQLPQLTSAFALLPEPTLGLAVAAGLELGRALVFVEGILWLPQRWMSRQRPDSGATIDRFEASLRGCWGFPTGPFELAPCLAVTLQNVSARGVGARIAARTATATWLGAGIGARARWQLTSWLGLVIRGEVQVGTSRPYVSIDGLGRIGQLGPAAIEFGLGAEWIL